MTHAGAMASFTTHDATAAVPVDLADLRADVLAMERSSGTDAGFHIHTGRGLALRLRHDFAAVDALPGGGGVLRRCRNPFQRPPTARVVDIGSGDPFDSVTVARAVSPLAR